MRLGWLVFAGLWGGCGWLGEDLPTTEELEACRGERGCIEALMDEACGEDDDCRRRIIVQVLEHSLEEQGFELSPAGSAGNLGQPSEAPIIPDDQVIEHGERDLVLLNDTEETVVLDRSFGPGSPFRLHTADGQTLVLDDHDDDQTGGFIATCSCACDEAPCPECEPPMSVKVRVEPGETYVFNWQGQVRSFDPERSCYPRSRPERGLYRLSVCADGGPCVVGPLTVPHGAGTRLSWSSLTRAETCEELVMTAASKATVSFRASLGEVLRDRPVDTCPEQPVCVSEDQLEAEFAKTTYPGCASVVVPKGDRMDVTLYLPLPEGSLGGARFRQTWDLSGLRLLDARYPQ